MDKQEESSLDSKTSEVSDDQTISGETSSTMDEEGGIYSDDSDSLEDIDALEDVKRLTVGNIPSEVKEDIVDASEDISKEPDAAEYSITNGDLNEEEKVRQKLIAKDKEEQLLSTEYELQKEEERRDRMKIHLAGYLELKAKKEIEKALLNEKKIIAQWLYPFRAAHQKDWELNMTKLRLAFQRALDFKKAHIHAIQRERKLCELNHLWADCAHYQISEELFEFLRKRCEKLKVKYLSGLEETKKYYLEREQQILDKCTTAEERARVLGQLRATIHENVLNQTKESLEKYKHQGEFLKEKEKELIEVKYITYVEKIAEELQASISPPEHRMGEIREIFNEWKEKYETFTRIYSKKRKEMQVVADEIPVWEKRVESARKRLTELRSESKRQQMLHMEEVTHLQSVSNKYDKISPSLRKIISDSEEVMETLRERKLKLDKILKLKKFCDKLEVDCDKMNEDIPFLDSVEQKEVKDNNCMSFIRELCSEDIEDQGLMENLYRKGSRVKLQNQILRHDIEKLKMEQMALKSDMKKYLLNISSGEWQRIPDELRFDTTPDIISEKPRLNNNVQPPNDNDLFKKNLALLNKKCRPINSKIVSKLEKNKGR